MTKVKATAVILALLFIGAADSTYAEVKSVQMKIGGYLCGN